MKPHTAINHLLALQHQACSNISLRRYCMPVLVRMAIPKVAKANRAERLGGAYLGTKMAALIRQRAAAVLGEIR